MARLESPTSISIPAPWLIEASHLLALDKLYDEYLPRLEEAQRAAVDEEVEEAVRENAAVLNAAKDASADVLRQYREKITRVIRASRRFSSSRRATVYLSGGRTLKSERFSDIFTHATATNEVPQGFRSSLKIGPIEVVVELGGERLLGSDLDINVSPNTDSDAQELYGALRNWISDFQSPIWLQKWRKYGWIVAVFLFFAVSITALVGVSTNENTSVREEAHKILSSGGVTPANQTRAIELLLAIASNYDSRPAAGPGPRFWATLGLMVLAALCISFCPKVVIGIWGGKARLKRWRIWVRLVAISIPAMVVSTVAMPWILKWFGILP